MNKIFLIGGGWSLESHPDTYGRFISAATAKNTRKILLVIAEDDTSSEMNQKYRDVFNGLGVVNSEIATAVISKHKPLSLALLEEVHPTGIFVCGGTTPLYHEAVAFNESFLAYIISRNIVYGGFSAGAALAAEKAIVGGWKIKLGTEEIPVLDDELAEGLEFLDIRKGLGLVPFSVDVHASQWGTLTRLIHAIDQGLVEEGWAIDENTMLEIYGNEIKIFGLGQAYRVHQLKAQKLEVEIHRPGSVYHSDISEKL